MKTPMKMVYSCLLALVVVFYYNTLFAVETHSYMYPEVVKVVDGDTISIILGALKPYPPLANVKIRVLGIDTPETTWRAKCEEEKQLGLKAKQAVIDLIGDRIRIKITDYKWDKYGGRINSNVFVGSVNLAEYLLQRGLAKPYTGKGPKPKWCE